MSMSSASERTNLPDSPVIGLLGGVASGKSLVAARLAELGCEILDGDRAGHDVLRQEEVKAELRELWGNEIFTPEGEVDRGAVARRVFAPPPEGPENLKRLEEITHPRITRLLQGRLDEMRRRDIPAIVLDAAVMAKAGWDRLCDIVLFVECPESIRLARALQRGWTAEQFHAREAAQEPIERKRQLAHVTIDNSGTVEQTKEQVDDFWKRIQST